MKVKRTLAAIAVIAVLLGLLYQNMTIHEELISLKRTLTEMRQPEDAGQAQGALVDQMTGLVEMVEKSRLDTERIHNEILQLANRVDELSVR